MNPLVREVLPSALILLNELVLDSSDDSSSDDDDIILKLLARKKKRIMQGPRSNFMDVVNGCDNQYLRKFFRINRVTFNFMLNELKNHLMNKTGHGRKQTSPDTQLAIALCSYFAHMSSYSDIASRFEVSEATALRCVVKVVIGLNQLRNQYIRWPENPGDNADSFNLLWRFPGVVGTVDGTHINIPLFKDGRAYINRKKNASIRLQVVVDHRMAFIHCYTGQVGSVHDQRVFRLSGLRDICNDHGYFPGSSHLLGDSAYTIQEHVLTPFRDNGHLTARQVKYNKIHSKARIVVERAIGMLKGRWRRLLRKLPMIRIELIPSFIMAACILHNICIFQNDFDNRRYKQRREGHVIQNNRISDESQHRGIQKRNEIMNELALR